MKVDTKNEAVVANPKDAKQVSPAEPQAKLKTKVKAGALYTGTWD